MAAKPCIAPIRSILGQVKSQIKTKENRVYFIKEFGALLRENRGNPKNLADVLAYLKASQTHKDMMERYWPTAALTPEEKLKRTANAVGFNLPQEYGRGSPLSDLEKKDLQQEEEASSQIFQSASEQR
ncbi:hypothetical protein HDV03_001249 [Kappamyces sp. JEL0829]|nr:hypothetical protein HDV03_001249 [Kappamyces sp. JEL0829]KAJ3349292.1 hypothetical protein HDU91_006406 [Kappamyces sp. JEL0680]